MLLKIGETDFTNHVAHQGVAVTYNTLTTQSAQNARGDSVFDIVNQKIKVSVTFKSLSAAEMSALLTAIEPHSFDITYPDPKTNTDKTINVYVSNPEVNVYMPDLFNPLKLDFVEM